VVIMGDIAVTLVDLIQRELLAVEETADGGDWLLTPLGGTAPRRKHGGLLDYEKRLLDGLSEGGEDQRALSGQLLPYALRFGLLADEQAPLVRFAHAWARAFADLPGWAPPKPARPEYGSDQPLFADVSRIPGAGLGATGWLPGCTSAIEL
jgi:hypothetical protein